MKQYEDYIILNFGKIIIKRNINQKDYYKKLDNKIISLTPYELDIVNNIFNNKKASSYYYRSNLLELIEKNENIENKEYIVNFLNYLEKIIPDNSKENFYRNIKTLKIKLNFDIDFNQINTDYVDKKEYSVSAGYNTKTNSLTVNPETLKINWEIANKTSNPNEFFWKEVNVDILHELAHMASSYYDHTKEISFCGFDQYPSETEKQRNRGLTEGMTEVIAMSGVPGTVELASAYYIEAALINQLIQIVGLDVIQDSYFNNKGTIEIEKKLNEIENNPNISGDLFRSIEDNYYLKDIDCKQNLLTNIQLTLISYFEEKLIRDVNNNKPIEEIETSINIFEYMLITPDKLNLMNKKIENYINIDQVSIKFEELKQNILNTNKQVTR